MRVGTFPAPWGVQTSTERSEVGANTPLLRSRRQTPLWRLSACTGEVYSRRLEDNLARKERYHCYSLDAVDFEGSGYAGKDTTESLLEQTADKRHIKGLLEELPEVQRRWLLLYAQGKSLREIARLEGVDHKAVKKSIEAAKKYFFKNF